MAKTLMNMMRYDLNLYDQNDNVTKLPPSGQMVSVNERTEMSVVDFANVGHVPVAKIETLIDQIPAEVPDVAYLIPMRALIALHEAGYDVSDMYAPSLLVRDAGGRILGARRLMQLPSRKKAGAK